MAFYKADKVFKNNPKKRTSIGEGLRKRGSFKRRGQKRYRGQGKG